MCVCVCWRLWQNMSQTFSQISISLLILGVDNRCFCFWVCACMCADLCDSGAYKNTYMTLLKFCVYGLLLRDSLFIFIKHCIRNYILFFSSCQLSHNAFSIYV